VGNNNQFESRLNRLNEYQRRAVEAICHGWRGRQGEFVFPIVDGPPGTGKTEVGVTAAAQFVRSNRRPQIVYLAYTHYAADRAREGFFSLGLTDEQVGRVLDRIKGERRQRDRGTFIFNDISDLTDEEQRRIRITPILVCTLYSAKRVFQAHNRPLVIIDEFSQVSPSLFFSTLYRANQGYPSGYSLLGDPNQLPIITTQPVLRPNIGTYIMAMKNFEPHRLAIQYRMHERICDAVNALRRSLNAYPLETHESVRTRTLLDLGYTFNQSQCPTEFHEIIHPQNSCILINTDPLRGYEETSLERSTYFTNEARLACRIADLLYRCYTKGREHLEPRILSPYAAQVGMINNLIRNELSGNCITVYNAQGREYPCVIISFARKNPDRWIGFLGEPQLRAQNYVACSRAQAKLVILMSFSTFRGHRDYDMLRETIERRGLIIDAQPQWGDRE